MPHIRIIVEESVDEHFVQRYFNLAIKIYSK
jgi:hypothetical protein